MHRLSISALLTVAVLLQDAAGGVQERGWKGIVPLRSTRADVERLLGPPMNGYDDIYDTEDERVVIIYQRTPCHLSDLEGRPVEGGWTVPRDTVISLRVNPKATTKFSELKIDRTKYEAVLIPHGGTHYYNNKQDGVSFGVDHYDGTVKSVTYFEPDDRKFRCLAK